MYNTTGGRPIGTTLDAGFNASGGRPIGTTVENGAQSVCIEDDACKLAKHLQQFELPVEWNTNEVNLSVNEGMLCKARKYIGQ